MANRKKRGLPKPDKFQKSIHRRRRLPIIASSDRVRRPRKPTASDPLIISASELRDFLRCRVKWAWRHIRRLEPLERPIPLTMGGLGHQILDRWYSIKQFRDRTVKAMERIVTDHLKDTDPNVLPVKDVELLKAMCVGYAAWARPRDRDLKITRLEPEMGFLEPLTEDRTIWVRGKIDLAFHQRSLKNTIGAFEHKLKKQIKLDIVDMNLQLSVYLWALRRKFPDAGHYVAHYNVLRKQMPGPRVKADLFGREAVERTDDEIAQWEIDTQRAVLDILDAAIYPNPMDACSWDCDFQIPCLMRGRPDDVQHMLETQFQERKYRG